MKKGSERPIASDSYIDWNIKKNICYIIALFICFFAIPHFIMCMPQFSELVVGEWTIHNSRIPIQIYLIVIWIGVPFSGGLISLCHIRKGGNFCPIFMIEVAIAILTYSLRIEGWIAFKSESNFMVPTILGSSIFIILLIESFSLLKIYKSKKEGKKKIKLLIGAEENIRFLSLYCFCAVVPLCIIQTVGVYLWYARPNPILLLPMVPILTLLPAIREQELRKHPLTTGGVHVILILFVFSCFLSTTFNMNAFWKINLVCVVVSNLAFFFMAAANGGI